MTYPPWRRLPSGESLVFGPVPARAESADMRITVRGGVFYGIVPRETTRRIEFTSAFIEFDDDGTVSGNEFIEVRH